MKDLQLKHYDGFLSTVIESLERLWIIYLNLHDKIKGSIIAACCHLVF